MFITEQQTPPAEALPLPVMNFESAGNAPKCPCTATNNADGLALPVMNFKGVHVKNSDAEGLALPRMY